jgi:AraC-like DNA-binding protein
VVVRDDYRYPPHRHVAYELVVPTRGIYRCRIDGVVVAARPGQVVVVQAGEMHADELRSGQRYQAVGLDLRWPTGGEARLLAGSGHIATVQVSQVLAGLAAECGHCDAVAASRQDALAAELLWQVVRALPVGTVQTGGSERERFVDAVERLFRAHAAHRLPVSAMAQALGLGVTATTEAFRAHVGLPPAKAFARWRVTEARRLLAAGDLSVAAAAAHLGFANPYHFARVVRRHAGISPSRMRSTSL